MGQARQPAKCEGCGAAGPRRAEAARAGWWCEETRSRVSRWWCPGCAEAARKKRERDFAQRRPVSHQARAALGIALTLGAKAGFRWP